MASHPPVAPGIPWLGVFLPYAPLQHLLFADPRVKALVMTSANLSEEPIAIDNEEARTRLGNIADAFLMHNREILQRCDDSVAAIVDGAPQLIRRARGFVPLDHPIADRCPAPARRRRPSEKRLRARARQIRLPEPAPRRSRKPHRPRVLRALARSPHRTPSKSSRRPSCTICIPAISPPAGRSSGPSERNLRLIGVQHHHAHIAACMAEHALNGPVIGLSLDGTGYGTDGRIWGGEVLICTGSIQLRTLRPSRLRPHARRRRRHARAVAHGLRASHRCRVSRRRGKGTHRRHRSGSARSDHA